MKNYCISFCFFSFIALLSSCINNTLGDVNTNIYIEGDVELKEVIRTYKDSTFSTTTSINTLNQEEYFNRSSLIIKKEDEIIFIRYKWNEWKIDSISYEEKEKKYHYGGAFLLKEEDIFNSENNKQIYLEVDLYTPKTIAYAESKEIMTYLMSDLQNSFEVVNDTINRSDSTTFGKFSYSLLKKKEGKSEDYLQTIRWSDIYSFPNHLTYQGDTVKIELIGQFRISNTETKFLPHTYK